MKTIPLILTLFTFSLFAQEQAPKELPMAAASQNESSEKSLLTIDPKARADDYVQAYELLKRDKPTLKVMLRTFSGMALPNVTDISASENGTLMFVKILSNQGTRLMIIPVEEILEISYSS